MLEPVDLDKFNEITGGDAAKQARFFRLFLESSEACLAALRVALLRSDAASWQKEAHSFKGMCLNLGARPLASICQGAETTYSVQQDDNRAVLASMEEEFERVKATLGQQTFEAGTKKIGAGPKADPDVKAGKPVILPSFGRPS